MSYTLTDTPEAKERIDRDLELVCETLEEGDSRLQSLILTGGFARGEGALRAGRPQNDYDLVAVRGLGRSERPYGEMREELERRLGMHVDLAPVGIWRLPWVAPTIFWYETARRGRVLRGRHLLHRIPVQDPRDIDPREPMRLLSNRAAGLLLGRRRDADERRTQASKAFLGALDTHLLSMGHFPPTHTERWKLLGQLQAQGTLPLGLYEIGPWLTWAYAWKTAPDEAPVRDADEAWRVSARTVLDALPTALRMAGLADLEAYGRQDGWVDRLHYAMRSSNVPGARRAAWHPTGSLRVATVRLLEASLDGTLTSAEARRHLARLARPDAVVEESPIRLLEGLRTATLP